MTLEELLFQNADRGFAFAVAIFLLYKNRSGIYTRGF